MHHIGSKSSPHRCHGMHPSEKRNLDHSCLHGTVVVHISINNWLRRMAYHHRSLEVLAPWPYTVARNNDHWHRGCVCRCRSPVRHESRPRKPWSKGGFHLRHPFGIFLLRFVSVLPRDERAVVCGNDRLFGMGVRPRDFSKMHLVSEETVA